jgi:hypothetical protein
MQSAEAYRIVLKELAHIPRGSMAQNAFRAAYSAYRQHDLSLDSAASLELALASAEAVVRQSQPAFVPYLDAAYFSPCLSPCM